jgi:hypothetical protein
MKILTLLLAVYAQIEKLFAWVVNMPEQSSAPATPPAGQVAVYFKSDGMHYVNSSGTDITMASSANYWAALPLTMASNAIAIPATSKNPQITITTTTSNAGAEDLTAITGGIAGQEIEIIKGTGTPTIKSGGTLYLTADFTLNSAYDSITMRCIAAGSWRELCRSNNG